VSTTLIFTLITIGLIAGALSGLVGVGGGIILVPAFVFFLNYTQHQAQGSSLGVLMLPVVALAFFGYYNALKGQPNAINLNVILLVAIGFFIGSFFGGKLALQINQFWLKRIFAILLIIIALRMLEIGKLFTTVSKP
jgi:uncharacterized protein